MQICIVNSKNSQLAWEVKHALFSFEDGTRASVLSVWYGRLFAEIGEITIIWRLRGDMENSTKEGRWYRYLFRWPIYIIVRSHIP
ncbi:unnamed protein product [Acanthoscelides obtectus]|uniref:Uncharacterized protein n=1 Tax=Acanthoscelides obtectus TaxID=200917 RepID=A0A9P0NZH3_ACAOB|nr:unnamed protein product [Acanthoscelides obtectus]CAK1632162.1 hypothetical protein AOBTE_LOCUS7382 [Acanthoscelides obtectus]